MKSKFLILSFILIINLACKGQSPKALYYDNEKYIVLDMSFISNIKEMLLESKKNTLLREREAFITRKIDDKEYLNNLDLNIQYLNQIGSDFNEKLLKSIIDQRKKNINIKSTFFINVFLGGDEFSRLDIILIENFDGTVEIFNSNNKQNNILKNDLIEFTNEFMLNTPYSFENKTPTLNGHYSIYKISAFGANKYIVSSTVVTEMLNYQLEIIKKMYFNKSTDTRVPSND